MDINKFVNSFDLERYLGHLRFDHPCVYIEEQVQDVDELFRGNNYLAILLLRNPDQDVIGHFVVLRKDNDRHLSLGTPDGKIAKGSMVERYTYFDCLGTGIPLSLLNKFQRPAEINQLTKPLMVKTGILCGKYCIAFSLAGNIPLDKFSELLRCGLPKVTPDEFIDNMYRLNFEDSVLTPENFSL